MCSMRFVASEIFFHPFAAVVVLIGCCASQRAKLEDVALAEFRSRPFEIAFDDKDRAAWLQGLADKILIVRSQPKPFYPEVSHPLDHETILVGVMHVVQLDIGVGLE